MSSVIIAGNTSGTITLDAPNVAGTTTLTLPTTSGTVLTSATTQAGLPANIAGNGPSFSATGENVSSANNTQTKMIFTSETFDTSNCWDTSTSRFTPSVAGYYQINYCVQSGSGTSYPSSYLVATIFKNGGGLQEGPVISMVAYASATASYLVYMNGTTDYLEIYAYQNSGITQNISGKYFSAFLARAA